jgi:hypothetical protein
MAGTCSKQRKMRMSYRTLLGKFQGGKYHVEGPDIVGNKILK